MSILAWLLAVLGGVGIALLLYWLLVTTEGVFLGRRVVVWLYDVTAHKYDAIKGYDAGDERLLVVNPVLQVTARTPDPLLLDVATGTGRVPFALMKSATFRGRVVGLDDSQGMLDIARKKLAPFNGRVQLVRHPAVPLPFPNGVFDAITCLEALEFFPSDAAALREMVRVLRPGGYLLTTRRRGWEGKAFLHRYRSQQQFSALLASLGLEQIRSFNWEMNYDLVTGWKPLPGG